MPKLPEGWRQINFRAPASWREAAERLRRRLEAEGQMIDFEESVRRIYRLGAEKAGVWEEGDGA